MVNYFKLLHFKKRKVERQLHQVLQVMHMYGNANQGMDDKIPIQRIPIFFDRFVLGVTIQLSFIDFGWAWITHNIKSHRINARIWVKHDYPTFFIPHTHSNP